MSTETEKPASPQEEVVDTPPAPAKAGDVDKDAVTASTALSAELAGLATAARQTRSAVSREADGEEDLGSEDGEESESSSEEGEEEEEGEKSDDSSYHPKSGTKEEDKDTEDEELKELNAEMGASSSTAGANPSDIHSCLLMLNEPAFRSLLAANTSLLVKRDRLGRTLLHLALLRAQAGLVDFLLSVDDPENIQRMLRMPFRGEGSSGKDCFPVLHLALACACHENLARAAHRCLELLLAQPQIPVDGVDNTGRTALHVACAQGASRVLEALLQRRADPGLRDDQGHSALHYAIDSRSLQCVETLLRVSDPTLFPGTLHPMYRCVDRQSWPTAVLLRSRGWSVPEADAAAVAEFAAVRGLAREWTSVCEQRIDSGRTLEELLSALPSDLLGAPSTALVTHPACLGHGAIPSDVDDPALRSRMIAQTPENPHRLEVLCGERGILRTEAFRELRWVREPAPAPLVDVLRVHEYWYVHKLMERVKALQLSGPHRKLPLDGGDTKVTRESWTAALRACGCVLEAVDMVCNEQVRNAFCAVRPPGHHLGPAGATDKQDLDDDPEGSQGFCLLNSVAVGAAYARCVYRHVIKKVAIVDFDIHHGNGTQAIVQHLQGKHSSGPRVGEVTIGGFSARFDVVGPPSCKPWMDPESDAQSVMFASVHGFGAGFYPGTGKDCNQEAPKIVNVALSPDSTSADFRAGLRSKVIPELLKFNPDIVFLSSGFDGHEDDLLGNCHLVEEDFVWVTQQLVAVANRCCQGRLVSVLEGGYNSRAEALSPFAQAVAGHVRTLMHTSPSYAYLESEHPREAFRVRDEQWSTQRRKAKASRKKKRKWRSGEHAGDDAFVAAALAAAAAAAAGESAERAGATATAPKGEGEAEMPPAKMPKIASEATTSATNGDAAAEHAPASADSPGPLTPERAAMRLVFGADDEEGENVAEDDYEGADAAAETAAVGAAGAAEDALDSEATMLDDLMNFEMPADANGTPEAAVAPSG